MTLLVVKAMGLITVQDLGRRGRMHEALPPGGALVPSMLISANRAVGNDEGAAAIEVCGELVVRAEGDLRVSIDGHRRADQRVDQRVDQRDQRTFDIALREGDELRVTSAPRRVTYLAVRGGIDSPIVLDGRGTHLSAGIGGLIRSGARIAIASSGTAALARGDQNQAANESARRDPNESPRRDACDSPRRHASDTGDAPEIRLVAGPDIAAFAPGAFDVLVGSSWRVGSSSDRVGTRLEGPVLARRADYVERSRPLVIGAIEVPRDGAPIVLGPEHPTTGGYPVLAVIASESLDAFHSLPLGGSVRFRRC